MTPGRVRGVLPALVTPLDEHGRLDRDGLDRLLDHVLAAPVAGISPCGSTGEGPLLSRRTRVEVVRAVAARVQPGAAIVAGAVSINGDDLEADLAAYQEAGATAALVAPPFYFPLDVGGVRRFYARVAERSPLPVVLYNIPAMTKVPIPAAVVGDLAAHPTIIGMKDSSRDMEYFSTVLDATRGNPAFSLLTGSDTLLAASVVLGAAGTIAASVNLVPALTCDLHAAAAGGRLEDAVCLQSRLGAVVQACRRAGTPMAWKAAVSLLGICSGRPAEPLSPLADGVADRLRADLVALGVLER